MSSLFPWKLLLTTRDRYSGNEPAERRLAEELGWTRAPFPCDIHRGARVASLTWSLLDDDVSGVLATAMSQSGGGALAEMRRILASILREKLEIVYDAPPGGSVAAYRQQVYDQFLPLRSKSSGTEKSSDKARPLQTQKRRFILGATFNADLQSKSIRHFCPYGCCQSADQTRMKFERFATWALLPRKVERFARSRWSGQLEAISGAALLFAHHGLGEEVLVRFAGGKLRPQPQPQAGSGQEQDDLEMLLDAMTMVPGAEDEASADRAPDAEEEQEPDEEMADAQQEAQGLQEDLVAALLQEPDFHARNRAYKQCSRRWAASDPLPRLAILADVLHPLMHVMHAMFQMASSSWDQKQLRQAAQSGKRTYRVLEACLDTIGEKFHRDLGIAFSRCPLALPDSARQMKFRSMSFRMHSRAGCSFQCLVRKPHSMYPYRLFRLLADGGLQDVLQDPRCMWDSLAQGFFDQAGDLQGSADDRARAIGLCEALAQLIQAPWRNHVVESLEFRVYTSPPNATSQAKKEPTLYFVVAVSNQTLLSSVQ